MASSSSIVFMSILLLLSVAPAFAGLRGMSMANMVYGANASPSKGSTGLRGGGIGMADLLAASGDSLVEPTNDDLLSDSDTQSTITEQVPDMSPSVPGRRTSKNLEDFIMASRSMSSRKTVFKNQERVETPKIRLGGSVSAGESKETPPERIGTLKIRLGNKLSPDDSKEAPVQRSDASTRRSGGFRLRPSVNELWNYAASEKESQWTKETESTWSVVDADSNGVVSMKELQANLWTDHGPHATMMQVQRFRAADANKDGVLQYGEFHEFLHVVDAPGLLYHEFRRLEEAAGIEVADEEAAEEEFHLYDTNGDGLLNHHEFEKLMAGHQLFKPRAKPRRLIASVESRGERSFTMDHMSKAIQKLLSSTSSDDFFAHTAAHGRFGGEL
eukprot:gnl/TRDRNA2_/TRDRNA2_178632_c0_seq1.p1 gnl/TRDRNA2_/TRDRNA2_178632_c0~~gnl/TRDRNA2_/TRDRNA2_178632_c0_seq1.p1  ORF type:complete len:387 (+),score=89.09 gnl/TRDRNA2_/TRDRNA2_178632_c0_seq1:111-1271(+)